MPEFLEFVKNVHKISECKESSSEIEKFIKKSDITISNEELSYNKRRVFLTQSCVDNVNVFNAIFNLHARGKENIQKIVDLVNEPVELLEKKRERCDKLSKLSREKYLI